MAKKKRKLKAKVGVVCLILFLLVLFGGGCLFYYKYDEYYKLEYKELRDKKKLDKIKSHYSEKVVTNKDTYLYSKDKKKYKVSGRIAIGEIVNLSKTDITKDTEYFYSEELGYYLSYKDVEPSKDEIVKDKRYKKYVMFNENVVTKEEVNLYRGDKVVYTIYAPLDKPIIYKGDLGVYIEYLDEALLVKYDQIDKTYSKHNTDVIETSGVPVTVYHFFYKMEDTSCNEAICHSENQIREHFTYLNNNGFFTINTTELRLFIEGKLRLPNKSILITIDDGARAEMFVPVLEEFKINATLFLVSGWYPTSKFASPYMEIASHTHLLHTPGVCAGGQGSPLKCLEKTKLVADLKQSRETLNGTTAFCYPFYELNDYAVSALKEAGFKIAFMGGYRKATKGIDLYRVPRIPLNRYTTVSQYASLIN